MKETIKINLNQRLFDLDADAYQKLKDYLDSLKDYFRSTTEEAEEILQDIEQRIAELLQNKLGSTKQVVTLTDIEEVIQLMGTADDFAREADLQDDIGANHKESDEEEASTSFQKKHRRLYRDTDNNILGGVCSGIASYFNVDAVWIRLAFIILLFFNGIGFLAYVILWIAVPGARTTAQKLQMKGKAVTIDNIQQSVKNEFTKVKDNLSNFSKSESYKKVQHTAAETFSAIGNVFVVFFKVVLGIIGIAFALAGIALLIGLVTTLVAGGSFFDWNLHFFPLKDYIFPLMDSFSLFGVALSLVILIPVVAILVGLIKLIFNVKSHNSILTAFAWTFWVLALVFVIATVASDEKFISYSYKENNNKIEIPVTRVLYINIDEESWSKNGIEQYSIFGKEIIHSDYNEMCYIRPKIMFKSFEKNEPELLVEHTAAIPAFSQEFRDDMQYYWHLNDSVLLLDEYFSVDEDHIWQLPGVRITIFLPDEQKVLIDRDVKKLIGDKTIAGSMSERKSNTLMVMNDGILEPVEN